MAQPKELVEKLVNYYFNILTITECADKYGIVPSTVYIWVKRYLN